MEYSIIIGWDADRRVYCVVESEIEDMWFEAPTKEELIAAVSEAAANFVKQTSAGRGAIRIYEAAEEVVDHAA